MSLDLMKLCKALAARAEVTYFYRGRDLQDEEVFSPFGLMPAILKRAESLSLMCLGQGLGVQFEDVEKSMLGYSVDIKDDDRHFLQYLCVVDVMEELHKTAINGRVDLNDLSNE